MKFSLFNKTNKLVPDLSMIGVDMHSHLLPGIDDGLTTIEDSIAFISEMQHLGYKKLILTPHIFSEMYPNSPKTILPVLEAVRKELKANNINIEIEAAAEYMVDFEFEKMLEKGEPLLTFGNKCILIEMSYLSPYQNIGKVIFDLSMAGYIPILAHPERYNYYHNQFSEYLILRSRGCFFQVNLLSLTGFYGAPVQKIAEKLFKEGMVELIGSDIHHIAHLNMVREIAASPKFHSLIKDVPLWNKQLL